MGVTFSCPGANCPFDDSVDAALTRSISFQSEKSLGSSRSTSFNGRILEAPSILKALGSGKMIIEGSLSFKARDSGPFILETKLSFREAEANEHITNEPESIQHEATVQLQKVYKSFRTRRKLADCAVLAEQRWWSLLDLAMLKRSSVSFFDIERPESVVSRWCRAKTRLAKVGKGLSKDAKARKLALQHWLEAIDHRHRYGHNLQFYFTHWLHCDSRQPFFYWLDVGEGRDVNLEQQCPRWKLQLQCIKYLGEKEREAYEVMVEEGKLIYKHGLQPVDTSGGGSEAKWIFVLSTSKTLYVGQKRKGIFQHSSFLAGGATSAAGRLVAERGTLKAVWPHSGHYRPTVENFQELLNFLADKNIDLTDVKKNCSENEEESFRGEYMISSQLDGCKDTISLELDDCPDETFETPNCSSNEYSEDEDEEEKNMEEDSATCRKKNLFFAEQGGTACKNVPPVSKEKILERISSKKKMGSYQLGRQISLKWTTGAGPRIVCVRDYPPELQLHALEQVCLSPGGDRT